MSEAKLNIKEETSTKKTRSPPKKAKVEQTVPKKKKLKTDADKAAEKAQHLRFGKAELTPDELSRLSKAQKREMYAAHAARSAVHREVDQQALRQCPSGHCAGIHLLLRAAEQGQHGSGQGEPCKALARDLHELTASHVSRQEISFCHRFHSSVEVTLRRVPRSHRNTSC